MTEPTEQPVPVKKTRKPRTPRPAPMPMVVQPTYQPPPVNPRITEMENKIFELVEFRSRVQNRIGELEGYIAQTQGELQRATKDFNRVEADIQYRQNMIRQMRGEAPIQVATSAVGYQNISPGALNYAPQPPVAQNPWDRPQESSPYQPTYPLPPQPQAPVGAVGSYPAINRLYPDVVGGPDGQQVSDADAVRQAEMRQRGY